MYEVGKEAGGLDPLGMLILGFAATTSGICSSLVTPLMSTS